MESTAVAPVPCPAPFTTTLDATVPQIVTTDFSAAQLANYQQALNSHVANMPYAHTFVWKPNTCCCVATSATLTIVMRSIQGGASATSADAGNDLFAVVGFGGVALVPSAPVYAGVARPFPANTTVTKVVPISGSALNKLNTEHTLSFFVEDDTSIVSATLTLSGCCLSK